MTLRPAALVSTEHNKDNKRQQRNNIIFIYAMFCFLNSGPYRKPKDNANRNKNKLF